MSKGQKNAWGWDPDSKFPTTEWTKILGAGLGKSVMGELYSKYGKPVYSYLRRKG
ncbi:MAG: hypothetical protein JSW47_18045 [Phycisphaerales bacterium]|nr:MAG: hypothetical protein JSW47_18045 [Phycisphaerales bacterium]UCF16952.1 MAG: hypothetical protein JSW59_05725 [Phycisphaerales bacterium]